jgi:hypothetical protein
VTFTEVRKRVEEARAERHAYFANLYGFENTQELPGDYFEEVEEWEMFPSNPSPLSTCSSQSEATLLVCVSNLRCAAFEQNLVGSKKL